MGSGNTGIGGGGNGANGGLPATVLSPSGDTTGATDAAAINAAITAAGASTKLRDVFLEPGDWYVDSTINIGDGTDAVLSSYQGVRLIGAGVAPGQASGGQALGPTYYSTRIIPGTSFPSTGAAVIQVNGPISGWGVENILIDNSVNNVASVTGLKLLAAQFGYVQGLCILGTQICIHGYTYASGANVAYDTIHNSYRNIWLVTGSTQNSSACWLFDSASKFANTCYEDITNLWANVRAANSFALSFNACDNIHIRNAHLFFQGNSGGACTGWNYGNGYTNGWPSDCTLDGVDFDTNIINNAVVIGANASTGNNRIMNIASTNSLPPNDPNLSGILWMPNINGAQAGQSVGSSPVGYAAPAVPASGTNTFLSYSIPVLITITAASGGTTAVSVGGVSMATIPANGVASFFVSPGTYINLTYGTGNAPTWAGIYAGG